MIDRVVRQGEFAIPSIFGNIHRGVRMPDTRKPGAEQKCFTDLALRLPTGGIKSVASVSWGAPRFGRGNQDLSYYVSLLATSPA